MRAGSSERRKWAPGVEPRVAFFDIDGTLTSFGTEEIPPSALEALALMRERGVMTFISTGRSPCFATEFSGGSFGPAGRFDGAITLNGAYVLVGETVLVDMPLPRDAVASVVAWAGDERQCVFHELDRDYVNGAADPDVAGVSLSSWLPRGSVADALTHDIYGISFHLEPGEEDEAVAHMPGCSVSRWHPRFADAVAGGCDKGAAVRAVMGVLSGAGIPPRASVAFGDSQNDVAMFRACETSVAMGSGFPEAIAAATYVTEGVMEDGLYNACVRLGMI